MTHHTDFALTSILYTTAKSSVLVLPEPAEKLPTVRLFDDIQCTAQTGHNAVFVYAPFGISHICISSGGISCRVEFFFQLLYNTTSCIIHIFHHYILCLSFILIILLLAVIVAASVDRPQNGQDAQGLSSPSLSAGQSLQTSRQGRARVSQSLVSWSATY